MLAGVDVFVQPEDQILTCNMPDPDEGVAYESLDGEAVAMIEEPPSVDGMTMMPNFFVPYPLNVGHLYISCFTFHCVSMVNM